MDKRTDLQTAAVIERAVKMTIPAGARSLHDLGVELETTWRVLLEPARRRAVAAPERPGGHQPSSRSAPDRVG